jgi:hypothetical protein
MIPENGVDYVGTLYINIIYDVGESQRKMKKEEHFGQHSGYIAILV